MHDLRNSLNVTESYLFNDAEEVESISASRDYDGWENEIGLGSLCPPCSPPLFECSSLRPVKHNEGVMLT